MRVLDLMNRKAIGIGFSANLVVWGIGLLMVGAEPTDTEMHLIFWLAFAASFVVAMRIVHLGHRDDAR
jgi:hypothetical protein